MKIMSLDDFKDEVFFEWLDNSVKFYNAQRIEMKATSKSVEEIITTLKQTTLDANKLKQQFTNFQDTIDVEFSKKGDYEKRIVNKLQNQVRNCLKNHLDKVEDAFQTSSRYERQKQRMHSSHNVETLRFLVTREPPVNLEQRFIGLSYAYANLVNGVFRFSIQDCYTWQKISECSTINPDTVSEMEVNDVKNYFKQKNDLLYFEGYDAVVRNAVAHSNFEFDPSTEKITYINERKERDANTGAWSKQRYTSTYSFEEMVENYTKLDRIYELIMCFNQMLMVSTCCSIISKRHP